MPETDFPPRAILPVPQPASHFPTKNYRIFGCGKLGVYDFGRFTFRVWRLWNDLPTSPGFVRTSPGFVRTSPGVVLPTRRVVRRSQRVVKRTSRSVRWGQRGGQVMLKKLPSVWAMRFTRAFYTVFVPSKKSFIPSQSAYFRLVFSVFWFEGLDFKAFTRTVNACEGRKEQAFHRKTASKSGRKRYERCLMV